MPKQGLTFYVLNEEVIRKRLTKYNIELKCYLCGGTLQIGDNIVRKRRKLYHRACWENSYIDIPDNILNEEDLCLIESGSIGVSSTLSIASSTIPTNITFAVGGSTHGDLNQKHC
jgi:hypothetical protein